MARDIGSTARIKTIGDGVLRLLPDRAKIYQKVHSTSDSGSSTWVKGSPLLHQSSELIPCRLDYTTRFTDSYLYDQEVTVNEYTLIMPRDFIMQADVVVELNGRFYETTKLMDNSEMLGFTGALVSEVQMGSANRVTDSDIEITFDYDDVEVTFNAVVTGNRTPSAFVWTFGDGTAGIGQTVTHEWAAAGTYTVTITITYDDNVTQTVETSYVFIDDPRSITEVV